jgi:hypothetical protein
LGVLHGLDGGGDAGINHLLVHSGATLRFFFKKVSFKLAVWKKRGG